MASKLDKRQLRSLSLRVASTWLKVAFSMDEFARLSMLEGFAGERPGKWSGKGRRGMGMAQETYPQMHANWTSPRDTGVYRAAVGAVDKVLKSSRVSGVDAEEVLQELNSNAGTSSGPSYKRIFYTVGQTNAKHGKDKDLATGRLAPNDSLIGGTLTKFLKQKALNAIKLKHEQMETPFAMQPGEGQYDPFRGHGTVELTDEDTKRLLIMAMRSNTSIGRTVRNYIDGMIDQEWRNPTESEIVRMFMAKMMDPRWSSPPKEWRQKKGDPRSGADAWFAAAVKKIGGEIAKELDVRRQDVSKALGGGATRVLKFMEKVGEKSNIDALLEKFADEIEYLAAGPGLNISADHHEGPAVPALTEKQTPVNPTNVLKMWLDKNRAPEKDRAPDHAEQHSIDVHDGNPVAGCGCDEDEMASRVAALWLEKNR